MEQAFTDFSARKLRQLTTQARTCAAPLTREQLWWRAAGDQNAVGNLLLHLTGNVRQWIVSGVGGAEDIRVRDREFSTREGADASALVTHLESTVEEAATIIGRLTAARLVERVTIQGYDVTVLEAVYHVVEHFSQHVGQIILLSRLAVRESGKTA